MYGNVKINDEDCVISYEIDNNNELKITAVQYCGVSIIEFIDEKILKNISVEDIDN